VIIGGRWFRSRPQKMRALCTTKETFTKGTVSMAVISTHVARPGFFFFFFFSLFVAIANLKKAALCVAGMYRVVPATNS